MTRIVAGSDATPSQLAERFGRLTDEAARRRFVARHPALLAPATLEALCAEVARALGADLQRARRLAETARWLAERSGDAASRARADRAAANALHFAGRNEAAAALYRAAVDRFQELGDVRQAAITKSSALQCLAHLGRYDEAHGWATAAGEVFERLADAARSAILEHNVANVLYRQDRWEEALPRYRRAYDELARLGRASDTAICLRNLAVCYVSLDRFADALASYRQGRALAAAQGLGQVVHEVDYNVAYLHYLRGQYDEAIQLYQAARRRAEEDDDPYHRALCDLDLSEIYLELNLVAEAEELSRAAEGGFARCKTAYEDAKAWTNLAIAAGRQGRADDALRWLATARQIFVAEDNRLWPALLDLYQAVVLYRAGRAAEAAELATAARAVFLDAGVSSKTAACELLLAELALERGDAERAGRASRAALERLAEVERPALLHQAYLLRGRLEEEAGRGDAALDAYRRARSLVERLSGALHLEELKISFLADKQAVYESLVWLQMEAGGEAAPAEEVFATIERAKSRSLAEMLACRAGRMMPRTAAPSALGERLRELRAELSWYDREIDRRQMGSEPPSELGRLRRLARCKEDELLRCRRALRAADPELEALTGGQVADLAAVRAALPPDAALIEYFIARGTVFVCSVDRERLEITPAADARRVRRLHRLLQLQLSKRALADRRPGATDGAVDAATRAHLQELYGALLAPVAPYLDAGHLIVVPHGFLHALPFHALHDGTRYLVERHSVSTAPSAGVFHACASRVAPAAGRALVLGVGDERAPHILEEARSVAALLPGATLVTGEHATAEALTTHGATSRFIHVATHGVFRRDNPMFSALQLGTSRLSLFDLYDLRLQAELVVLSGCGTGLQAVVGGDELVGLTRGLLYAGARAVLVTLWEVDDASTSAFMCRFYGHLTAGGGPARALRAAMLDLAGRSPHPYYWAPFVLVGHPGPTAAAQHRVYAEGQRRTP